MWHTGEPGPRLRYKAEGEGVNTVSTVNHLTPSFGILTLAKFAAALKAEACPDIHELTIHSRRRESLW